MATKHFYYFCLIGITLLGGCFILFLKHKIKPSAERKGMIFIALGLFSFATIGIYKLFDPPIPALLLSDIDRIFSVFTNIFFVAALPFFSNAFIKFRNFISLFRNTEQWVNSVFIFFAFLAALFAVIERNIESVVGKNVIIGIDSLFSTITIGLVAYAIYKSITTIWTDNLSKLFIAFMLTLFPLSQLLLPLTAIFPDHFNHLYFSFLLILLIGITLFIFIAIAYYSISNLALNSPEEDDVNVTKIDLHINSLTLGFDSLKKVYFIEIQFNKNSITFTDRIENRKILLPFSNWILFSIAKKLGVKLFNQDIALTKFRMVEYWNKESETKINQDFLFTNDLGMFEFNFDSNVIELVNLNQLESKLIIIEAIQKNCENFAPIFPEKDKTKISASDIFTLLN